MNDPHVVALIYTVDHGNSVIYDEAEPLCQEEEGFRLKVKDKKAWFYLKDHYATEADARKVIEEFIHVWEFDVCLKRGPDFFRLKFEKAEIEDRSPTPGVVNVAVTFRAGIPTLSIAASVVVPSYPSPPSDISVTPDVKTMYDRCIGYRRGHEPLTGMAYFCLNFLEYLAKEHQNKGQTKIKRRDAAAEYFQIGKKVLSRIGKLSTERGGPLGARKHKGVHRELTSEERQFLEEAIKKMIRRVAEKAHAPKKSLTKITFSDLPAG